MALLTDQELDVLASTLSVEEYDRLIEDSELECNAVLSPEELEVAKLRKYTALLAYYDSLYHSLRYQFMSSADKRRLSSKRSHLRYLIRYHTDSDFREHQLVLNRSRYRIWYDSHKRSSPDIDPAFLHSKLRSSKAKSSDCRRLHYFLNRDEILTKAALSNKRNRHNPDPDKVNCYCEFCGQPMHLYPSQLRSAHHFCSGHCSGKFYARLHASRID